MKKKRNIQLTDLCKMNLRSSKFITAFCVLISFVITIKGQEYSYYTQYMFNGLAINPAYAGSQDYLTLSGDMREQWVGMKGAPSTQTVSVHAPFLQDQFGLGLIIINDKTGVTSQQEVAVNYAYKIMFPSYSVALGLKMGFNSLQCRFDQLEYIEEEDVQFQDNVRAFIPLVGFGVYLKASKYYVGLSIPHLYKFVHKNYENASISSNKLIFLTSGYLFSLNDDFKIKPSLLTKANFGSSLEMDLNANVYYKDDYCIGISYKSLNSLAFIFEIGFKKTYYLGYSYDLATTRLIRCQAGTHEVSFNIYFNRDNKAKILNPRFF